MAVLPAIYSIGHSTYSIEYFGTLLTHYAIDVLVDVRSFPGSKWCPQFNRDALNNSLMSLGVQYIHLLSLGGRRKPSKDSINTVWRNASFRGYADYMDSVEFVSGIKALLLVTSNKRVCIMCSEALWWRCHRSMISDFLKSLGYSVFHILPNGKLEEHPYTQAAKIINGALKYGPAIDLFNEGV